MAEGQKLQLITLQFRKYSSFFIILYLLGMLINRFSPQPKSMTLIYTTQHETQLWLGDYYAATDMALLKQNKIQSVLTAAALLGIAYRKEDQIQHKIINAFDLPSYKMAPHFEDVFQFISNGLKIGNVFVHCGAGISRSATFVIAYLMRTEGMPFEEALTYVQRKRSIVLPNEGFQKELQKYEATSKQLYLGIERILKEVKKSNFMNRSQERVDSPLYKSKVLFSNQSNDRKSYSLGPLRSLSNKLYLSVSSTPNKINRGSSLHVARKQNHIILTDSHMKEQREQSKSRQNKQNVKGKSQMSKLSRQFLVIKRERTKILTLNK